MRSIAEFNWDLRLRRQYRALVTIQLPLSLGAFPIVAGTATIMGMESQALTVPYRAAIILLALVTIAMSFLLRKRDMYRGKALYPLLLFIVLYTVRLASDTITSPVPTYFEPSFYWLFFYGTGIIPMMPLMIQTDDITMRRSYLALITLLLLGGLMNLYAATSIQDLADQALDFSDRLGTDAVNPISVGHVGASLAILSAFGLTTRLIVINKAVSTIFFGGTGIFGLVLLAMSASRGPQLALIIVLLMYLAASGRSLSATKISFAIIFIIAGYFALDWVESSTSYAPLERLRGLIEGDISVQGRQEALFNAWSQFVESPIVGSGLEEKTTMFYPHNIVVESFMATGIAGGLAFCVLSALCLSYAWRCMKTEQGWLGMLFVQYYMGNLVSGAIFTGWYLWVSIGCILGWAEYDRSRRRQRNALQGQRQSDLRVGVASSSVVGEKRVVGSERVS